MDALPVVAVANNVWLPGVESAVACRVAAIRSINASTVVGVTVDIMIPLETLFVTEEPFVAEVPNGDAAILFCRVTRNAIAVASHVAFNVTDTVGASVPSTTREYKFVCIPTTPSVAPVRFVQPDGVVIPTAVVIPICMHSRSPTCQLIGSLTFIVVAAVTVVVITSDGTGTGGLGGVSGAIAAVKPL